MFEEDSVKVPPQMTCVFMLSPHLLEAAKPVKCPLPLLTHSGVSLSFIIFISLFTETANEMNVL